MNIVTSDLIEPLALSQKEKESTKILYLAKFAPYTNQTIPTFDPVFPALSSYHFDLFRTLNKLDLDVEPMADLGAAIFSLRDYGYIFSVQNSAPFRNSEVLISAAAECFGIPYLGAPPNIRALAEDKYLANTFAKSLGIKTPKTVIIRDKKQFTSEPPFLGPFIIKARYGVNSELLTENSVQDNWRDLKKIWKDLKEMSVEAVVEEFIPGDNVGAPFIEAIGTEMTGFLKETYVGGRNILTRDCKQDIVTFDSRKVFQEGKIAKQLRKGNKILRSEIGPCDYFRSDWRVHEKTKQAFFVELNICCSLARGGGVTRVCRELGWSYEQTIETILASSLRREPSPR